MNAEPSALEGGVVRYRSADGMGEVMLNRPEVLNAINGAMHRGILAALERAAADDAVRAVVLRGSGRALSLHKPVIAAVHGYCLGQACELAAVCDLTVAASSATFGEVEINHGWGPPLPITPFVLGLKRAKEVLLLGEMFDAELAVQIGLVNRVVDDDGLDAEVARMVGRIAGLKPEAVATNKRLVNSRYEKAGFVTELS